MPRALQASAYLATQPKAGQNERAPRGLNVKTTTVVCHADGPIRKKRVLILRRWLRMNAINRHPGTE